MRDIDGFRKTIWRGSSDDKMGELGDFVTLEKLMYSLTCFERPSIQVTWKSLLTGCLLIAE